MKPTLEKDFRRAFRIGCIGLFAFCCLHLIILLFLGMFFEICGEDLIKHFCRLLHGCMVTFFGFYGFYLCELILSPGYKYKKVMDKKKVILSHEKKYLFIFRFGSIGITAGYLLFVFLMLHFEMLDIEEFKDKNVDFPFAGFLSMLCLLFSLEVAAGLRNKQKRLNENSLPSNKDNE